MRLLHTKKLKLDEFFGTKTPAYAILSHRWEEEEVIFQDLVIGKGREKKGWNKLEGSCAKALQDGWEYLVSNPARSRIWVQFEPRSLTKMQNENLFG